MIFHDPYRLPSSLCSIFAFLGSGFKVDGSGPGGAGIDFPAADANQTGVDQFDNPNTGGGPTVETPTMPATPAENITMSAPPSPSAIGGATNVGSPVGAGPVGASPGLGIGGAPVGGFAGFPLGGGGFTAPGEGPLSLYSKLGRRSVPGAAVPGRLPMPQRANPYWIAQLASSLGARGARGGVMPATAAAQ